MGTIIDFGPELGEVDFGEMSDADLRANRDMVMTVRQRLIAMRQKELEAATESDAATSLTPVEKFESTLAMGREAAGRMVGQGVSALGRFLASGGIPLESGSALERAVDPTIETERERRRALTLRQQFAEEEASPVTQAGKEIVQQAEQQPVLPGTRDTFAGKLAAGIGSTAPLAPLALLGPLAGPVASGALYGGSAAEGAYQEAGDIMDQRIRDAAARGDDQEAQRLADEKLTQQNRAFALNAPIGFVTEGALGIAGQIPKIAGRAAGGAAKGFLRTLATDVAEGFGREAVQEGSEQLLSNVAAQQTFDPNRPTMEGVGESALIGGATGGLLSGAGSLGGAAGRYGDRVRASGVSELEQFQKTRAAAALEQEFQNAQLQGSAAQEAGLNIAVQSRAALSQIDAQLAQTPVENQDQAQVVFARGVAEKLKIAAQYLQASQQAAVVQQQAAAKTEEVGQAAQVLESEETLAARDALIQQTAQPLAQLEAAQANRFPTAPMAPTPEPPQQLLSPEIVDRLRAARQQDMMQQADVQAASTIPEIKLGVSRPPVVNASLESLSDEQFYKERKKVVKLIKDAEKRYDAGDPTLSLQSLAEAQDKYSSFEMEKFRRDIKDRYAPDLFSDLLRLSMDAGTPGSEAAIQSKMILLEINRQGASLENLLSELDASNPDKAEILRGQFEDLKSAFNIRPQPTPPNAVQIQEAGRSLLGSATPQPEVQVELPGVGQQNPKVNPPREEVALGKRKSQQLAWLESPIIQEAFAEPVQGAPIDPWKTDVARFANESRAYIYSGADGKLGDMAGQAQFEPVLDSIHDAVMRDMVRNFEKDGGKAGWNFEFAWKRAMKGNRSVVSRASTDARKTQAYKDLRSQSATEIQTGEGDIVSVADTAGTGAPAFGARAEPIPAAQYNNAASINQRLKEAGATPSQVRLATMRALREFSPSSFERNAGDLDEDLLEDPKVVALFNREKEAFRAIMESRKDVTVAMPQADVEAALREAFSGKIPEMVTVISDPNHILPDGRSGQNTGAYIVLPVGEITVNSAFIDTPMRAVEAVMEEGIHGVWEDPAIAKEKAAVLAEVTEAEVAAKVEQGYAPEVAREEAAVEKIIDYLRSNSTGGTIGKFIEKLWSRLKEVLGLSSNLDQARNRILQRAMEYLTQSRSVSQEQDAAYMAAAERGDLAEAQRMVDEAAKRAGYTNKLWHGTSAYETVVTQAGQSGSDSAKSKLIALSEKYGLGSDRWGDLSSILPRLEKNNPEFGVTKEDAELAVRLSDEFKKSIRFDTYDQRLAFSVFNVPSGENELGVHLGTKGQAETFGPAFAFYVKANELLRLPDLGTWNYQSVMREARRRKVPISESEYDQVFNQSDNNQALRELLKAKGYDSVVYRNEAEGAGDSLIVFDPSQIKSADPITRDDAGNIIPISRRFNASSPDIRESKSTGFFLNTEQAGQAISQAASSGADPESLTSIAQAQGSLIPRTSLDEANALAKGSVSDRLAFSLLKGLRKIAELGDRGWLSSFPSPNPTATKASEMGVAKELAAEAVVRSDLGLRKLKDSLSNRLTEKKEAMAVALQEIPKALDAKLDAELAKAQADKLVRDMQRFLADQIKVARSTADSATEQAILLASRTISETKRSIGSAVGTALTAIANEMPRTITGEAAMLKWLNDRVADKSQPPIMSDLALNFLTTRLPGTRTAPITRINLSDLVGRIREIQDDKGEAQKQITAFRAEFGGKPVTAKRFASSYRDILDRYSKAIGVYKEISGRIRSLDNQVTALNKAIEVLDRAITDTGYDLRLKDAVKLINAGSAEMKIVYGVDGKPTGTITVPNPITRKAVTVDLTPGVTKVKETVDTLRELMQAHEIAIADPTTDPYEVEQLQRNLPQIQRLSEGLAPWLLRSTIPESVPFLGGRSFPSLWELKAALPWFGNRLSTPNNILGWIGGPLQRSVAGLVEAYDVAELALENLRSDPDLSKPSQERINLTMLKAMQAHGLDPSNPEDQELWGKHASRIISQNQNAESVPFKVGESTIYGLKVLPEDIEATNAQKAYSKAVFQIGQKAPKGSIMRNLFERPLLQAEEIAGKVVLRSSADYGLKMARTASLEQLPIVREWVKSSSLEEKTDLLTQNFADIVLGAVTESNPEFASPFSNVDKAIFRELVRAERTNSMPFTDLESFLDWWAERRAEVNETEVADERAKVEGDLIRAMDQMMGLFGDNYAAGRIGEQELVDMNQRNITPPTIITALSSDNQFTRPRGALLAPSSFYQYDLSGVGRQETFKTNLLNHLAAEQLLGWKNLLVAIRAAMEKYDRRKRELVGAGRMSEGEAIRRIQAESRRAARSITNETDYATLRYMATSIEAMNAELERMATEYISVPEDMPVIRTVKAALSMLSSALLSASSPIVNNLTGAVYLSMVVASWLRRSSLIAMTAAGPKVVLKMIGNVIGRGLGSVAKRVGWFDKWMRQNSGIGSVIGSLMIESMRARNEAINALTLNVPDVGNRVRMINALPGSNGYMEPGKYQHAMTALANWAQSGLGIQAFKKVAPKWMHPMIDSVAKAPLYAQEQVKRFFPQSTDRLANMSVGQEARTMFNDPGFLQSIHDSFVRREANDPDWDKDLKTMSPEELGSPASKMKFIRDMLASTVPFERAAMEWYKRTKSMSSTERLSTPLLPEDQEDQFTLNVMKLANQRTQSTTPPVLRGKGPSGLARSVFGMFARYGINMAGVMGRRFAEVQGSDDGMERWVAGFILAFALGILSLVGVEVKQLLNNLQGEPRNALTLSAAADSPEAAGRYMAGAIASQIPWGGETLQQLFGGSPPTQPFDVTRNVPLLGFANSTYNMVKRILETGDVVFPVADMVRSTIPISKIAVNALMPGDAARREAASAVRLNAPTDIELRQFTGSGSRATPMQPLVRSALNAAMSGDDAGYQEAYDKAVAYQVGTGKSQKEAERAVNFAIAAKDPISSVVGRQLSDADISRITANMSSSQKSAFMRARSITSRTRPSRGLLRGRRRGVLRGKRRNKPKRSGLLKALR